MKLTILTALFIGPIVSFACPEINGTFTCKGDYSMILDATTQRDNNFNFEYVFFNAAITPKKIIFSENNVDSSHTVPDPGPDSEAKSWVGCPSEQSLSKGWHRPGNYPFWNAYVTFDVLSPDKVQITDGRRNAPNEDYVVRTVVCER